MACTCSDMNRYILEGIFIMYGDVFKIPHSPQSILVPKSRKDICRLAARSREYMNTAYCSEVLCFASAFGYSEFLKEYLLCIQWCVSDALSRFESGGFAPLHLACMNSHIDVVHLLVRNNANLDLLDKFGKSALWYACNSGNYEIVLCLVQNGATDNLGSAFLNSISSKKASLCNMVKCVSIMSLVVLKREFLLKGILSVIANRRDIAVLHAIIDAYGDRSPETTGEMLLAAITSNQASIVQALLHGGICNVYFSVCLKTRKSALYVACELGLLPMVRLLLANKAPISAFTCTGRNCLHRAIERGHFEILEELCLHAKISDVIHTNNDGIAPITLAENKNKIGMIQAMLNVYRRAIQYENDTFTPCAYLNVLLLKYPQKQPTCTVMSAHTHRSTHTNRSCVFNIQRPQTATDTVKTSNNPKQAQASIRLQISPQTATCTNKTSEIPKQGHAAIRLQIAPQTQRRESCAWTVMKHTARLHDGTSKIRVGTSNNHAGTLNTHVGFASSSRKIFHLPCTELSIPNIHAIQTHRSHTPSFGRRLKT